MCLQLIALEQKRSGRLLAIFPIFVGECVADISKCEHANFFIVTVSRTMY